MCCVQWVCKRCFAQRCFWKVFEIHKSPGDGHCLLHSIKSSLLFQTSTNVTISDLIEGIINEVLNNSYDYIDFHESLHDLYNEIDAYMSYRICDAPSGDLEPQIVANAINVNRTVVTETRDAYYATERVPCARTASKSEIVIWKYQNTLRL